MKIPRSLLTIDVIDELRGVLLRQPGSQTSVLSFDCQVVHDVITEARQTARPLPTMIVPATSLEGTLWEWWGWACPNRQRSVTPYKIYNLHRLGETRTYFAMNAEDAHVYIGRCHVLGILQWIDILPLF